MIITKEQRDCFDVNGNKTKELIVSYVNQQGTISFLKYPIPISEMFQWKMTTRAYADPIWKSYDGKFVRKVSCKRLNEYRVNELLCSFGQQIDPIFEANVPQTWFCDIEVDVDDRGFPKPEEARNPINTIAITKFPKTILFGRKHLTDEQINSIKEKIKDYNPLFKNYEFEYREYKDEYSMMSDFLDFIKDIPALTGWNFIGYDWIYIYNRCKDTLLLEDKLKKLSPTGTYSQQKFGGKTGANIKCRMPNHKIIYDYMMVYRSWDRSIEIKENNTLDFVAEKALGIKKVQHSMGFQEFYRDYYEDYCFYNCVDTILVEQIDKKLKTSMIWYNLTSALKIDLNMAFSTVKPTEVVMVNFLYPEFKCLATKEEEKDNKDDEEKGYEGAFVWPTIGGVYKQVGSLDFSSLYPTTQRQFNISPETYKYKVDPKTYIPKDDEILTSSGAVFDKSRDGVLPRILTEYFTKRKNAKMMKKQADSEYETLKHILEKRIANGES